MRKVTPKDALRVPPDESRIVSHVNQISGQKKYQSKLDRQGLLWGLAIASTANRATI